MFEAKLLSNRFTPQTQRIEDLCAAQLCGVRPDRTFRAAATKFPNENQHMRSIDEDALHLPQLDPFIGNSFLKQVHLDRFQPFIAASWQIRPRPEWWVVLSCEIVRAIR